MSEKKVKIGDVVQVTDPTHNWFPALLIVRDFSNSGVLAGCIFPTNDKEINGVDYMRLPRGSFTRIGEAAFQFVPYKDYDAHPADTED